MHKKSIALILTILFATICIATMPASPVGAVTLNSLTPNSGPVDTEVRVIGTIDTLGGAFTIWFDIDDDGNAFEAGEAVVTDAVPSDSYAVNVTFDVPHCVGSDAGNAHIVALQDLTTASYQSMSFFVKTARFMTVAPYDQEGDNVTISMSVTGGVSTTFNNYILAVTDPNGTVTFNNTVSFTTDGNGTGTMVTNFPTDFSTGASSDLTGTYNIVANRTLPGAITNAATASFTIGLTDKASYKRFETVNVKTSGWTPNQNVSITITDPAATVVKSWPSQNLTTGVFTGSWTILPWNVSMGDYTLTAVNATGNNKAVDSIQTFEVGPGLLSVTVTQHIVTSQRTQTLTMKFAVRYPDLSLFTATRLDTLEVTIFYWPPGGGFGDIVLVDTLSLTAANYGTDGNWTATWKIPRDAPLGSGWYWNIFAHSIMFGMEFWGIEDIAGNRGAQPPFGGTSPLGAPFAFIAVNPAVLSVAVTKQPVSVERQELATAGINITYPDGTAYTDADLNTVNSTIGVYANATNIANVTLDAADYNAALNEWTLRWTPSYKITIGTGYNFKILTNELYDIPLNVGPSSTFSTNNFNVTKAVLIVPSINTDKATYVRGEFVRIYFDATYADGSPVVKGTSAVTLTAPDGFTTTTVSPVHTSAGRWQVTWWLSEAQQTGNWTVTLAKNGLDDDATPSNEGPATTLTTTFTVLSAAVTLEDIIAELDALSAEVDALSADLAALSTEVDALSTEVDALSTEVDALSTGLAALSADLDALSADLAALDTTVGGLASKTDLTALQTDLAAVIADVTDLAASLSALDASAAKATDLDALEADIADVKAAVDALQADVEKAADVSGKVGSLNIYIIIAIVLSLIAAIAAIASVLLMRQKIAG